MHQKYMEWFDTDKEAQKPDLSDHMWIYLRHQVIKNMFNASTKLLQLTISNKKILWTRIKKK